MTKYTCSRCNSSLKDAKYFIKEAFDYNEYLMTKDEHKCILHCKKDDWFDIKNNIKLWEKSNDKVVYFWSELNTFIEQDNGICDLKYIVFPTFVNSNLISSGCTINKDVSLFNCTFLDEGIFLNITFNKMVIIYLNSLIITDELEFQFCTFNGDVYFYNINENQISSASSQLTLKINGSIFNKTLHMAKQNFTNFLLNFNDTTFNGFVDFKNTIFKDVMFLNSNFNNKVTFRDSVFLEEVDFRDTTFNDEANFLDISSKEKENSTDHAQLITIANRETARIIKYNFEKVGNKIEANKYHALELEQKRIELKNDKSSNWKERWVFNLHHWSSLHSTNWFRVILWILFVGALTIGFVNIHLIIDLLLNPSLFKIEYISKAWNELCQFIYIGYMEDKLKEHPLTFLFNKISLGYLYYQFLMSVRKDTRK